MSPTCSAYRDGTNSSSPDPPRCEMLSKLMISPPDRRARRTCELTVLPGRTRTGPRGHPDREVLEVVSDDGAPPTNVVANAATDSLITQRPQLQILSPLPGKTGPGEPSGGRFHAR